MSRQKARARRVLAAQPRRFAHPFYTSVPHARRPATPFGRRMTDWVSQQLGPIPKPKGDSTLSLEQIIGNPGVQEIQAAGSIRFHAVGDTGRPNGRELEMVAEQMTGDFNPDAGAKNPAFFLHLGDVIYGQQKDLGYRDEFYRPYHDYPGKIIAIPGNHDGEVFSRTDPVSLKAFQDNFCAPAAKVPVIASQVGIFRETVTLPGVYWLLDAPFVQIIGLYSNIAEGPGFLDGKSSDQTQINWLTKTLKQIKAQRSNIRKALLIVTHHPPFSSGGHKSSSQMLAQLDQACTAAGIMPDAILSGHAHNYQRYTRRTNLDGRRLEIPFVVAGTGGHGVQAVPAAKGEATGDHTFDQSFKGYGYLLLTVSQSEVQIEFYEAPSPGRKPFDSVVVDLRTSQLR